MESDGILGMLNQFKRQGGAGYKQKTSGNTHVINVAFAISKFSILENAILSKYKNAAVSLSEFEKKVIKMTKSSDLATSIILAEKQNKLELSKEIEQFLMSSDIDNIMVNNIKSREQGLDYAVAIGVLDDYVDYLRTGLYEGPLTMIKD